jgi:hypothetical protein
MAFCEDRPTLAGAKIVARQWLDSGAFSTGQIRAAMTNFAREIKTNPQARFFDLRTLANSLSKYLDAPKDEKQVNRRILWRWRCEKCGADWVGTVLHGITPLPLPCIKAEWGDCDGTAHPMDEGEAH